MTTAAGLPAVRESLHLAVLTDPAGSATVVDVGEAAVEHYALNYSRHPPHILFAEIRSARELLAASLTTHRPEPTTAASLQRCIGWMTALLGNLAFHLGDVAGARAHLRTAAGLGDRVGDDRLTSWAWAAQAMVAREQEEHAAALLCADRAAECVPAGLPHAQMLGWARLGSLAALGRADDVDAALAEADRHLDAAPEWEPGRFGYDDTEHQLHQADAHLRLGRARRASTCAQLAVDAAPFGSGAWVAAALLLSVTEAVDDPADAAARALDVLARTPAARLRATNRKRLTQLVGLLDGVTASGVPDLTDRVLSLAPPIDAYGVALGR